MLERETCISAYANRNGILARLVASFPLSSQPVVLVESWEVSVTMP